MNLKETRSLKGYNCTFGYNTTKSTFAVCTVLRPSQMMAKAYFPIRDLRQILGKLPGISIW